MYTSIHDTKWNSDSDTEPGLCHDTIIIASHCLSFADEEVMPSKKRKLDDPSPYNPPKIIKTSENENKYIVLCMYSYVAIIFIIGLNNLEG